MAFENPSTPNLADFTVYVYEQGVPEADLPPDSQYLVWAYNTALPKTLRAPPCIVPILYVLAVYQLGMHTLLKIAQDQPDQTFFAAQRTTYKLLSFVAGPVFYSMDQATSNSLKAPDFLSGLTMSGLDLLKTPWGQEYLAYSQAFGPTTVGVS